MEDLLDSLPPSNTELSCMACALASDGDSP